MLRSLTVTAVSLAFAGVTAQRLPTPPIDAVACPMDAQLCKDGSSVMRVPPACDFALCADDTVLCDCSASPQPRMANFECDDGSIAGPACGRNTDGACAWQIRECPPTVDPCAAVECEEDQECILERVECVMAPCPPMPVCKDMDVTTCNRACDKIYAPVCGSDGATYGNECELDVASCVKNVDIEVVSEGECVVPTLACDLACPEIYAPVCGSDGVTYGNECELEAAACSARVEIRVASDGECQPDPNECVEVCASVFEPVCGSNGITYGSVCELESEACLTKTDITVASDGACDEPACPDMCMFLEDPVCGSDGATYSNNCELDKANCGIEKTLRVEMLFKGSCSDGSASCDTDAVCTAEYASLCGTDGQTYGNVCELVQTNCGAAAVSDWVLKAYAGECQDVHDPCEDVECEPGTVCVSTPVLCVTTPCPEQAECVPAAGNVCMDEDDVQRSLGEEWFVPFKPCEMFMCGYDAVISSAVIDCPQPNCNDDEKYVATNLECCGHCRPDECSAVRCAVPSCPDGEDPVQLDGQCCLKCPKPVPEPCELVTCALPLCEDDEVVATLPGDCCPSCQSGPDCSLVLCAMPECAAGFEPVVPDGQCCPQCTPVEPTDACNFACGEIYQPVCATVNGVDETYSNECDMIRSLCQLAEPLGIIPTDVDVSTMTVDAITKLVSSLQFSDKWSFKATGECDSTNPNPNPSSVDIPDGCAVWYNGCAACDLDSNGEYSCPDVACVQMTTPYCKEYTTSYDITVSVTIHVSGETVDSFDMDSFLREIEQLAGLQPGDITLSEHNTQDGSGVEVTIEVKGDAATTAPGTTSEQGDKTAGDVMNALFGTAAQPGALKQTSFGDAVRTPGEAASPSPQDSGAVRASVVAVVFVAAAVMM